MFETLVPDLVVAAVLIGLSLASLRLRHTHKAFRILSPSLFGLGILGAAVLISLLGLFAVPWVGIPIIVIGGIAWAGWLSRNTSGGLGLASTAFLSAGIVFGYGTFVHEWRHSLEPDERVELSPQEASQVTGWDLVVFQDALCRPDLKGIHSWRHDTRTNTRTYAPLVQAGWVPTQPVPAWISLGKLPDHGDTPEEACHLETAPGEIAALAQRRDRHIDKAVQSAMETHGLYETRDTRVFRFAPSEKKVRSSLSLGRALAIGLGCCWLFALGRDLLGVRKRRRSSTPRAD